MCVTGNQPFISHIFFLALGLVAYSLYYSVHVHFFSLGFFFLFFELFSLFSEQLIQVNKPPAAFCLHALDDFKEKRTEIGHIVTHFH